MKVASALWYNARCPNGKGLYEMGKRLEKSGKAAKTEKQAKKPGKMVTYKTKVPDFDGIVKRMERALNWSYGGIEDMKTAVPDIRQHSKDKECCLAAFKVFATLVLVTLARAMNGDKDSAMLVRKLVTCYEDELNLRLKEADKIRKGEK